MNQLADSRESLRRGDDFLQSTLDLDGKALRFLRASAEAPFARIIKFLACLRREVNAHDRTRSC